MSNRGENVSNQKNSIWSAATDATLKALVGQRYSARKAASEINTRHKDLRKPCTRNAVIGRCTRLGLKLEGGRGGGTHTPTAKAKAARGGTPKPYTYPPTAKRHQSPPKATQLAIAVAEPLPPPTFTPLPAMNAGQAVLMLAPRLGANVAGDCHWPIGDPESDDFRFCYAPVVVGSYCPYHSALGTRPSKAKARDYERMALRYR